MKRVACFYIPEPFARGYKTRNEFHKYRLKRKFISDSFNHMLNSKNVRKIQIFRVFLPILLRKTRQCRCVTYDITDELRRLSLSKICPALCHRSIFEIAIFHSITEKHVINIFSRTDCSDTNIFSLPSVAAGYVLC